MNATKNTQYHVYDGATVVSVDPLEESNSISLYVRCNALDDSTFAFLSPEGAIEVAHRIIEAARVIQKEQA